jgi:hypothetical protein
MMEKGEGPRFYQNIKRMMRSLFTSLKKRHMKLMKFSLDQAIDYLGHFLNKEIPQM